LSRDVPHHQMHGAWIKATGFMLTTNESTKDAVPEVA
jgi:hypothetical protein